MANNFFTNSSHFSRFRCEEPPSLVSPQLTGVGELLSMSTGSQLPGTVLTSEFCFCCSCLVVDLSIDLLIAVVDFLVAFSFFCLHICIM